MNWSVYFVVRRGEKTYTVTGKTGRVRLVTLTLTEDEYEQFVWALKNPNEL